MASPYDVTVWVYDLSNGMAKSMSMMFLGTFYNHFEWGFGE